MCFINSKDFLFEACVVLLLFVIGYLLRELRLTRIECETAKSLRQEERKGRIKAEIALRSNKTQTTTNNTPFISVPIGILRSCFKQRQNSLYFRFEWSGFRNGTPRQSLLVPESRAILQLSSQVAAETLDGLDCFSHVWLVFAFHLNTNLHSDLHSGRRFKAKVQVPRLNGAKKGVFATRTPHRFNNIGLSLAKIIKIEGSSVFLAGLDIVDGTPVLDLKPYLPVYDSFPEARVPDWVNPSLQDPLKISSITFPTEMTQKLSKIWHQAKDSNESLFESIEEFEEFLRSVLTRDIRSVHQRLLSKPPFAKYNVLCENVNLEYSIDTSHHLTVTEIRRERRN